MSLRRTPIIALLTLILGLLLPAAPAHAATLNGHTVILDGSARVVPWTADPARGYDTVITSAWDYLVNRVPNDPGTGKPAYYSQSYLDPDTQQMAGWPHNPAGLYAMLIESAITYYAYSGNRAPLTLAENVATWQLDHGMTTSGDDWANVPYASGDAGSLTYRGAAYGDSTGAGDGTGYLEPDKVGQLGYGWLQLWEVTGNTRYRDAAIAAGNALASHVRTGNATQSPWPFRVRAADGAVREQYCANVIDPIRLFDGLIEHGLGNTSGYRAARTTAWTWMMTYPMVTNVWANYFEDVGIQSDRGNVTQMNALMTARYLLEHPETDANWQSHVQGLIAWSENTFGENAFGATVMREQIAFPHVMGSHTARYASVNALLSAKTDNTAARTKAYYALNWATYMARPNGVVIDGPTVGNQWFTDGYGDYVRHFLTAMSAVPEWAPAGENHVIGSTSAVSSVTYASNRVRYTTVDPASTETMRLAFAPGVVTAGGVALPRRSDLAAQGYTYDAATGVVRVRHDDAASVDILSGVGGNLPPTVTLTAPSNGAEATTGSPVSLAATASDSDGSIAKVEFFAGATRLATDTTSPYATAWTPTAAGTYGVTAVATDNAGATTTSPAATVTVSDPTGLPSPWATRDVGAVGAAGSAAYSSGVFTVRGSGVDIWDAADSFRYVYRPLSGDGSIVARVAGQEPTDPWALAGVMIREDLTPGSLHAIAALTPGHGLSFTWRGSAGGSSSYTDGGPGSAPQWVKLVRAGSTVTAYRSADGSAWTQYAQASMPMGASVYAGLAVTSHVNGTLGTATFDNVTLAPATTTPPPSVDTMVVRKQSAAARRISSPPITTSGPDRLLVAFVGSDGPAGAQSISGVTGGGLAWRLARRANGQYGTAEIWTAPAPTTLSGAVVTATRSTGSYGGMLTVVAVKDAAVGATAGADAVSGAPSASLVTSRPNSWVWATGTDWDRSLARTVGAGQTKVKEFLAPSASTYWLQRRSLRTPAAGTTVTINDTAPTADRWNLALIELTPR